MSFSFSYKPEQDRLLLILKSDRKKDTFNVFLTRRLIIHLANYLRRYIEKHTQLPGSISVNEKEEVLQFIHQSEVEANPPTWSRAGKGDAEEEAQKAEKEASADLVTRIDVKYTDQSVALKFYKEQQFLMTLTLQRKQVHVFLFSMGEICQKAGWELNHVFGWAVYKTVPLAGDEPGKSL